MLNSRHTIKYNKNLRITISTPVFDDIPGILLPLVRLITTPQVIGDFDIK